MSWRSENKKGEMKNEKQKERKESGSEFDNEE